MKYFKQIDNDYITEISTGNGFIEISELEYNTLLTLIQNIPESNIKNKIYKLNAKSLQYDLVDFIEENNFSQLDNE